MLRPTWVEIDLAKFRYNVNKIRRKIAPPTKILAVIKADGYGHGALPLARLAGEEQIAFLGVATPEEGIELRQAGIVLPILIMGSVYPFSNFQEIIRHRLTPTIASLSVLENLINFTTDPSQRIPVHLKVDTGMGRIGVSPEQAPALAKKIVAHKNIFLEGVYTHLACADSDRKYTDNQLKKFYRLKETLEKEGIDIPYWHSANSAAILRFPESHSNLVRPGLALYGLWGDFQPVLSWKTKVVFLKKVSKGRSISYGRTFITKKDSWIVTLPVGYADGYSRRLSNSGEVLIHNQRAKVVGTITMDMMMIDVTPLEGKVTVGDEVVLIGEQGREKITVQDLAKKMGTVSYEVVCTISKRVPRVYK